MAGNNRLSEDTNASLSFVAPADGSDEYYQGETYRREVDGGTQGDFQPTYLNPTLDSVWQAELERSCRCDYLYAEATA